MHRFAGRSAGLGLIAALALVPAAPTTAHLADVQELYADLLGAPPTAAQRTAAMARLEADGARLPFLLDLVDSPAFADRVADGTFIVATYRQILDRDPTVHEWVVARHFVVDEGARSVLVAALLSGVDLPGSELNREAALEQVRVAYPDDVVRDAARKAATFEAMSERELAAALRLEERREYADVDPEEALAPIPPTEDPAGVDYETYFGYLHAHSNVSFDAWQEGSPGPKEAYRYARYEGGLDWFSLSDHAEYISTFWWNNEWKKIEKQADAAYVPGTFVALRGFEYSNPIYGHLCVFGTESLLSAFTAPTLRSFYRWLRDQDGAVATFNHPGEYDYLGNEFYHFAYYGRVDAQIIGQERLTSNDHYGDNAVGYGGDISYLDEALRAGWHIGGVSAQDNHSGGWGTSDDNRTGVLALELTRDAILDALAKRRFYSTMDTNLELSFQANGLEMGSIVPGGDVDFVLHATDPDAESFQTVTIYRGTDPIHEESVSGSDVTVNLSLPAEPAAHHYYAFVLQADGDGAMTTPIWVLAD